MAKASHLTITQAIQKLKHYCGYQERCHSEVVGKMYDMGITPTEHDEIIAALIEEDYLNEERFAIQFAGGKFRLKQWGKTKIKYELKQKRISVYCIKKALEQIDEDDYQKVAVKLFEQKLATLRSEKNVFTKRKKVSDFLQQRGFEFSIINELLKSI